MTRIVHLSFWSLLLVSSAAQACEDQLQLSDNNRKTVVFSDDCFLPSSDTYTPILLPPSVGYFSEKDQYFMKLADKYMPYELKSCKTEEDVFTLIKNHEREQEECFLSTLAFSEEPSTQAKVRERLKKIDENHALYGTTKLENCYNEDDMKIMHSRDSKLSKNSGQKSKAIADLSIIKKSYVYRNVVLPVARHYGIESESILPFVGEPRVDYLYNKNTPLIAKGFTLYIPQEDIQKSVLGFNDIARLSFIYSHELGGHGRSGNGRKIQCAKSHVRYYVEKNRTEYSKLSIAYEQTSDINGILNPDILANGQSWTDEQRKMLYFGGQVEALERMNKYLAGEYDDPTCDPHVLINWQWFGHQYDSDMHPSWAQRYMVLEKLLSIINRKQISHRLLDFKQE